MGSSNPFARYRISAKLLQFFQYILALAITIPNAHALDPNIYAGCTVLTFEKGAAELSNSGKVAVARLLANFQEFGTHSISVTAWSDEPTASNSKQQLQLAKLRAQSIKQLLVDIGIQERTIYWTGMQAERTPIPTDLWTRNMINRNFKTTAGIVSIEYIGHCLSGRRKICEEISMTCAPSPTGWAERSNVERAK